MARTRRTLMQSIIAPVISTSLYFVVFGSAIGSRISDVNGTATARSSCRGRDAVAAVAEHLERVVRHLFPRFTGTIYEILSAPVSYWEIVIAYVGAAASKSILLGVIIPATAGLFTAAHPASILMVLFLVLTAVTFSLFGFVIGIWADSFEKLQLVPLLIITPLTFLGGSFYSVDMLPPAWRVVTLFNPIVYSGQRLPLVVLRDRRRARGRQPRRDVAVPRDPAGDRRVDVPHRLQAEELTQDGRSPRCCR